MQKVSQKKKIAGLYVSLRCLNLSDTNWKVVFVGGSHKAIVFQSFLTEPKVAAMWALDL